MLPKFYMLVGISGSGKSFIANQLKGIYKDNIVVCSSDAIRKELWGDENDQRNPQKVFELLHKRVKKALKEGKNVVYDATNLSRKRRMGFLKEISNISCFKSCLLIATPFEECVENDRKRERTVGEKVIRHQRESFQCPYFYEGWDSINIMNPTDKANLKELDEIVEDLKAISHDNPHHDYSIGEHILAAKAYCDNKRKEYEKRMVKYTLSPFYTDPVKVYEFEKEIEDWHIAGVVANYHDIGKGATKRFRNSKGEPTEIAHYYNHHNVSAYEIISRLRFAELLKDDAPIDSHWDFDFDHYWLMIAVLVNLHMEPFFRKDKIWDKFSSLIGEYFTEIILKFHEADLNSH